MVDSECFRARLAIRARSAHRRGLPKMMTALVRPPMIVLKAFGRSLSAATCTYCRVIPRRCAACSASFQYASRGVDGSTIPAMRAGRGESSERSSTCFPRISGDGSQVSPVMLPPGRARDEIYPRPTGSLPYTMTIGTRGGCLLRGVYEEIRPCHDNFDVQT